MSSGGYTREDFNDEMNDMELALEKEQECQEFYKQSAEEVSEAGVEALYEWFANAGEKRGAVLQTIHIAAQDTDSWAADVLEQTQSADVPFDSAPAFDASTSGKPGQVEIMTLRQAIELEKKSASIYHIAAQRSRDKTVRELWRYLAASEEAHMALLDTYFDGLMQLVKKSKKKKRAR